MLNKRADTIESLSYRELGNLAIRLTRNNRNGIEGSKRQLALWGKASTMRHLLKALESRDRMDYKVANKLLSCLVKVADINDFPSAPLLLRSLKPTINFSVGEQGVQGVQGEPGSDATVDVVSGDDEISVVETAPGGIRTFTISYAAYTAPAISLAIDTASLPGNTKYREVGDSLTVNLNITVTKGRDAVDTSTITTSTTLNDAYQLLFDADTVNTNGFQTITGVNELSVVASTTYTADVTDTPNATTVQSTDNIYFNYPMLYGSKATLITDYYADLSKVLRSGGGISPKATTTVSFNSSGVAHYFYFAAPTTYGLLTSIKDENGFEHLNTDNPTFTETQTVDVDSTGLTNNWQDVDYTVYRTTAQTIINGSNFTFSWQ